jgi:anti-sigma factor RsiW
MICDKELLVGYLYDELTRSEQNEFDRHLGQCRECRAEVEELRATRTHLALWRPPEPDLGFEIVRRPAAAPSPASRWSISPIWGLAAAAVLVLAAASAIANLEVRAGRDGFVVRTGWNRAVDSSAAGVAAPPSESRSADAGAAELQTILQRVTELESRLSRERPGRDSLVAVADTSSSQPAGAAKLTDAEILKRVREIVSESEKRQQSVLATRVVQSMRELEAAYRTELIRLQQGINQNQGLRDAEVYRQREMLNQVYRLVGQQR